MDRRHEFDQLTRTTLERLNVPLAVYQVLNGKVVTLLVSDGLLALQAPGTTREELVYQFNHDMFRNVDDDDATKVAQQSLKFSRQGGHYQALYKEKLYGKDEWSDLFANGDHLYTPDGTRLALVWYTDVSNMAGRQRASDAEFHDTVDKFFRKNTSAMAVVTQDAHRVCYFNEAICRILPPKLSDDIGRTFEEFFFGDAGIAVPQLFERIDMGIHEFEHPLTHERMEASVSSTYWEDEPAYLIYVYEDIAELPEGAERLAIRNKRRRLRKSRAFAQFMQTGEENDLPYAQTGYKGFLIWNLSTDSLIRCGGVPYLSDEDRRHYTYEAHRKRMQQIAEEQKGDELLEMYTTDYLLARYETHDYPRSFESSYRVAGVHMVVHTDFTMMESPDTGDVYLKVQNENITARSVTDTLLQTMMAGISEFVAFVDAGSDMCVVLEGQGRRVEGHLSDLADELGRRMGIQKLTPDELVAFMEEQCGTSSEGLALRRVDEDTVKDIRVKVINRDERRYFLSCTNIGELGELGGSVYYDSLTGLPNMMGLRNEASTFLNHIEEQAGIAYFNLMGMKAYNERYGYVVGDELLKSVALILREQFEDGYISRVADDRFIVIAPAERLDQRVVACHQALLSRGNGQRLRAGLYVLQEGDNIIAACDRARMAYEAVRSRYDIVFNYYERAFDEAYWSHRYIIDNFDRALNEGWIKLYYQPVVDADTGQVRHMEGLCRWIDPQRGTFSPGLFIPVLEDSHLITRLDMFMVEQLCRDMATRKRYCSELGDTRIVPVSINFSRVDLEHESLVDEVAEILDQYGVSHDLLVAEITESALTKDADTIRKQIKCFHDAGFDVWMDDFGAGYSSLGGLKDFDFDVVKFDMQFVSQIETDERSQKIVSSLMSLCANLGMHTVSEGVETAAQLELLHKMGCDLIQGYLVSKPVPLEELGTKMSLLPRLP